MDRRSDASWASEEDNRGKSTTRASGRRTRTQQRMLDEGKQTFRFDTFGDEAFWSDALQLHRAIAGANSVVLAQVLVRRPRSPSD